MLLRRDFIIVGVIIIVFRPRDFINVGAVLKVKSTLMMTGMHCSGCDPRALDALPAIVDIMAQKAPCGGFLHWSLLYGVDKSVAP